MNNATVCALMPHPPIMIPEVGKGAERAMAATIAAVERVAETIRDANPQTIVLITPHGPVFPDSICISVHPRLRGHLAQFGVPEVVLGFETDHHLVRHIVKQSNRLGVNLLELTDEVANQYRVSLELDHGALVPLYFLHKAGFKGQLVHLSVGMLSYEEMYTFGKAVQAALGAAGSKAAVIASGDLSHRLLPDAPGGYSPQGKVFDEAVVAAFKELNVKALLQLDRDLIAEAGECGLRPVFFLLGVAGGMAATAELLSYEGPFGVGYAVGLIRVSLGK